MVRALALLYEATGGGAWRNNLNWLSGEPCVDGWFGVHCCPQALPVLRGDDCTADGGGATGVLTTQRRLLGGATGVLTTQGSAACHSGSVTGTALDLATCVVVKVLLPSNNLIGSLVSALCELPFLQHFDLSGNTLTGSLPSAADCLPRLTYLDLTQTRSWDDEGGVSGRAPEWLLDRLDFMAPMRLANNALDDPTAAESAVAIRRLWQRCSTLGAEQCSGVPPIGCSAFNRQGQRYEVELDGLGCVRCPTPLEIFGIAGGMGGIGLLLMMLVVVFRYFVRKYPEHAKTHVATIMILWGHLQTLAIIGSMQLGWPLVIQKILASINLPLMGYIPLPCILTDPVLKALLSYAETIVVLLPLVGAWLVARCTRKAWAEDILSMLFSFLFTFGLRVSVTLFARYDEDQTRQAISRLVASLTLLFLLYLFLRFRWLLREARRTKTKARVAAEEAIAAAAKAAAAKAAAAKAAAAREEAAAAEAARVARAARAKSVERQKHARCAAEAVRYLTERYASDEELMKRAMEEAKAEHASADQLAPARWPLRSQWQLVVWTRQGLLFLVSFFMDCVVWFSPYEAHRTTSYIIAGLAIIIVGGFWGLQAQRQPYAMRRQHLLDTVLYAVDILAVVGACVYGALTNDGAAQDGSGRLVLELCLGLLLGLSVLFGLLFIVFEIASEQLYIRQWYLHHGLVKVLEGTKEARQIIDEPIEAALRDGAVRLIDCAWLLDSARSDKQLPRVTKVVARLVSDEPTSVLLRRLATHCGTSSICITVEAASAASAPRLPPPSPPEVAAAKLERRPSARHTLSRLMHNLTPRRSSSVHLAPQDDNTVVVTFHLSTFDEAATLTATDLRRKAEEVRDRLVAQLHKLERVELVGIVDIVEGAFFLPRCQDMPPEAFLPPQRAAALYARQRRGVKVVSYGWRSPGVPDPDGCALAKIRDALRSLQEEQEEQKEQEEQEEQGLFVDVACMPQTFSSPSWYDPKETLRFGANVDQGPLTVLKFEWGATERVATEHEAQVCVDKVICLCEENKWCPLAPIADFKSLGLAEAKEVAVLFHGRYVRGAYRFHEGEHRINDGRYISEGYVRFRTVDEAAAARRDPDLKRMCRGEEPKQTDFVRMCTQAIAKAMELFRMCGKAKAKAEPKSELKEPTLMGEHVFENELKFRRGLSVMGSLYASATGTCVLQLTAPPGKLGSDDDAPRELVSERTGTVFVIEDKSLKDKSLEELQMELGDGVLACEKGSWGKVVVRVDGEMAVRAAHLLKEGGYPLRRKDRKVYPMYNLRPYGSRGWPTFETSAASIVLAHLTQVQRRSWRGEELSDELKQRLASVEASGPKLINIDVIDVPFVVTVAQSPERLLRECKKKLLSKQICFTGKADRKVVVQLLSDFEDSIAVHFDQKRAEHLYLRTQDLEHALTVDMREARRMRVRKLLQLPTLHVEPILHFHVFKPTLIRFISSLVSSFCERARLRAHRDSLRRGRRVAPGYDFSLGGCAATRAVVSTCMRGSGRRVAPGYDFSTTYPDVSRLLQDTTSPEVAPGYDFSPSAASRRENHNTLLSTRTGAPVQLVGLHGGRVVERDADALLDEGAGVELSPVALQPSEPVQPIPPPTTPLPAAAPPPIAASTSSTSPQPEQLVLGGRRVLEWLVTGLENAQEANLDKEDDEETTAPAASSKGMLAKLGVKLDEAGTAAKLVINYEDAAHTVHPSQTSSICWPTRPQSAVSAAMATSPGGRSFTLPDYDEAEESIEFDATEEIIESDANEEQVYDDDFEDDDEEAAAPAASLAEQEQLEQRVRLAAAARLAMQPPPLEEEQPERVPLAELAAATAGWAAARKVGEGGFGVVYRADALPSRPVLGPVAIKRLGADSQQGLKELMREVQLLGTCRHEHLLPLLAFCYEGGVGCLVYPLMAGGSLEDRLIRDDDASRRLASLLPAAGAVWPPLTWQQRLRAVRDAMRALVFLHTPTATRPVILHRDIKPANVLLDLEGNAKLADVGLAKEAYEMQTGRTHLTTRNLAGTTGYIDPLYADSGQYSQTTDAYAMGVTLLVALSGRRALQAKEEADDALEDLTDGAALQRALDPAAGWPEPAARDLLGIVKALTSGRQQRRMPLASALETIERVCEDQGVRPGMAELAADSDAPRMCVICMDAPRTTRFSPCGHSQCCEACADLVIRRGSGASRCPYCRTSIATMMTDPNITNEETFVAHS